MGVIFVLSLLLVISFLTLKGLWLGIAIGVFGLPIVAIIGFTLFVCLVFSNK